MGTTVFEAMGGRKLVFGVLMLIVGVGLALQGKLNEVTAGYLLALYGIFAGANALTTIKALNPLSPAAQASTPEVAPQPEAPAKPAEPAIHPHVEQALVALMQRQQQADANLAALNDSFKKMEKLADAIISSRQT